MLPGVVLPAALLILRFFPRLIEYMEQIASTGIETGTLARLAILIANGLIESGIKSIGNFLSCSLSTRNTNVLADSASAAGTSAHVLGSIVRRACSHHSCSVRPIP